MVTQKNVLCSQTMRRIYILFAANRVLWLIEDS